MGQGPPVPLGHLLPMQSRPWTPKP
jgi:hypothetical protein